MILTCPTCSARFLIDSAAVGPDGRWVRCGRCSHEWFERAPDDPDAPAVGLEDTAEPDRAEPTMGFEDARAMAGEEAEPDSEGVSPQSDARAGNRGRARSVHGGVPAVRRERSRWPARLAWLAVIILLVAIGAGASLYRDQIIARWPAAEQLYAAVGMEAPPLGYGLSLVIVESAQEVREGTTYLVVEGRIENTTARTLEVPPLRAALYDAEERELQSWTFVSPVPKLLPDENVTFVTEISDPAPDAVRLSIVFHEPE